MTEQQNIMEGPSPGQTSTKNSVLETLFPTHACLPRLETVHGGNIVSVRNLVHLGKKYVGKQISLSTTMFSATMFSP